MEKENKKILGMGHPRTGTGYTANLIKRLGLDVGHEVMFKDGIVAWQLATNETDLPFMNRCKNVYFDSFNWETKIYNLRNPLNSIVSIVFTETKTLEFRNMIGKIEMEKNRVSMAIQSILCFDEIITEKKPDIIFRIEHDSDKLFDFLNSRYEITWSNLAVAAVKDVRNKRKHPDIAELKDEFENVPEDLKLKINSFCVKYDYPNVY